MIYLLSFDKDTEIITPYYCFIETLSDKEKLILGVRT